MPADAYPFAEIARSLIAVKLTDTGRITVHGMLRPAPAAVMNLVYASVEKPVTAPVEFTMRVTEPQVAIFTVEPDGWTVPYEGNIVHFLGHFNPFGTRDVVYQGSRNSTIKANRTMHCTYEPDGFVTMKDDVGGSTNTINISKLVGGMDVMGAVWIAVRVPGSVYVPQCASLEFKGGLTFDSQAGSGQVFQAQARFLSP